MKSEENLEKDIRRFGEQKEIIKLLKFKGRLLYILILKHMLQQQITVIILRRILQRPSANTESFEFIKGLNSEGRHKRISRRN